ncbi:hypothetical protein FRB95_000460 [Tulasnella sp. JGI-2019a]|nr:hypothetical protein FRB95_000460 [Tulasnella sp. JGI-2019a]
MSLNIKRQNTGDSSASDLSFGMMSDSFSSPSPSPTRPNVHTVGDKIREEERQTTIMSLIPDEIKAASLKLQLQALQSEYNALSRDISQKRYSLTSIGVLPMEVMGEMFVYAVGSNDLAALSLSQVCLAWRSIIQSTPRAWSIITIRFTRHKALKLAEHYFRQSRACPLHVAVIEPPQSWTDVPEHEIWPVADLVKTHWNRIKIFRMYKIGGAVAQTFLQSCFPVNHRLPESPESSQSSLTLSPPPMVRPLTRSPVRHIALHLFPNYSPGQPPDYGDFRLMPYLFGDPRDVSTFTLENGLPCYDMGLFNWGTLRSIQIEEPHMFSYSTPIDRVLDILAANPLLHAFVLAGNRSNRVAATEIQRTDVVNLPSLRVLSLQSVDIPFLLDNISCPILEKLKLGNELGARWDGSVAGSLRNLIKRSKYPSITRLRINEIATPSLLSTNDWACFEMLPQLQSFRCHHTHFPDQLLDQFIGPISSPSERNDSGQSSSSGKVLCPSLSKLVFENCDLTGAALVSLAKARSRGAKEHVALQELWTWQCPNVQPRDEGLLQEILGNRYTPTLQKEDPI